MKKQFKKNHLHLRGQIESRVLIYLLAVFLASILLVYGYTVIKSMMSTQEDILLIDFKESLKNKVNEKSYEFQTSEKTKLTLPDKYTKICFSDIRHVNAATIAATHGYFLISNSIAAKVRKNVFIFEKNMVGDAFYVGKIQLSDPNKPFECYDVDGSAKIKLKALGRTGVQISEWQ